MTATIESLLDGLTEPQRQAVEHMDGPLLVLAGPGSGKTTVVTRRIAHLIAQGIPPWQILALTFTNKAAGEMRERIERLLPEDIRGRRGLTVATFHSFCARLLRRYATEAELDENYTIYDTGDQREAIKGALKTAGMSSGNWTPASVGSAISSAKNQLLDADEFGRDASDFYSRSIARVYKEYEKTLRENHAVDFDDLLLRVARLLRDNEPVRSELQARFQYILIDEYQDTNHAQFVIAHALAAAHRNICVVGDPDQSIYGWRGADIRNILEFEQQYSETTTIPLGQNFRSTGHIVRVADTLIRHNRQRKHKDLHTELNDGEMPTVITCQDEHHEADLIVDAFRKRQEEGTPWKEMAVLYRVNALSRVMEEHFRDAQIPYVIARGTAFYERKEIKDALAYLRLVANPNDEVSLKRIVNTPTRGIGKTSLDRIEIFAIQNQIGMFEVMGRVGELSDLSARAANAVQKFVSMIEDWRQMDESGGLLQIERTPLAELVERVVRESGLEGMYRNAKNEEDRERVDNLAELISAAAEFTPRVSDDDPRTERADDAPGEMTLAQTLTAFLESVALVSDADMVDPANGAVTLMTLHAAKGLEFDVVALAGLEEGLLPHARSLEHPNDIEEERRLCFVGITRARRHLMLVRAASRSQRGFRERTIPSQFLRELPEDEVTTLDMAGEPRSGGFDGEDDWASGGDWRSRRRGRGEERDDVFVDDVPAIELGSWTPKDRQAAFPVGCMVRHPKFGVGRVEGLTPRPSGTSARVNFRNIGVKTLILQYAKLERMD